MAHDSQVGAVRAWRSLAGVLPPLLLLLVAGCATRAHTGSPVPAPAPTSAAPSPAASGHRMGQTVDADHSFVEVTVYKYEQPTASGAPAPNPGDYAWGAADVQTCASASAIFSASISS